MNADEIVMALRDMATYDCGFEEQSDVAIQAADLIEIQAAENTKKDELVMECRHAIGGLRTENMELTAQLTASQRREKAVGDLTKLATKPITPCHSCAKTCVFPASLAPECQPPKWCREWEWRGIQEAEKGET